MKVYVITQGIYSDKKVIGVVSSLEGREGLLAISEVRSMEFELDNIPDVPPGYKIFTVEMKMDGKVIDVEQATKLPEEDDWRVGTFEDQLWRVVFAESEEHAVKIVNEERVQLIASGANR